MPLLKRPDSVLDNPSPKMVPEVATPVARAPMPAEYLSFRLGGEEYGIDILRVEASHITGIGCVHSGDTQRMLILLDIVALMSSADMGLMNGRRDGAPTKRLRPA